MKFILSLWCKWFGHKWSEVGIINYCERCGKIHPEEQKGEDDD